MSSLEHWLPTLSTLQANTLALFFAGSYVGSLYISQNTRIRYASDNSAEQERVRRRDDPDVIRARLIAVTASTALSCVIVFSVFCHLGEVSQVCRYSQLEL